MNLFFSKDYSVDVGKHTFPTRKFECVADVLKQERGIELLDPGEASRADLERAHSREWVDKILKGTVSLEDEARMELKWSKALACAHAKQVAGTYAACVDACNTGLGLHAGGGAHHAFAEYGEGFCVFNDIACALIRLKEEGRIARAASVDLDVHQGNGTAALLAKHQGLSTFSMHQADIYPEEKERGTVDIRLLKGTGDQKYLKLLKEALGFFLDDEKPEVVVYQAGVDCWEKDLLGGLKLSSKGIGARDAEVFRACFSRKIAVAVTLGGGYAKEMGKTVDLHVATLKTAMDFHRRLWSE